MKQRKWNVSQGLVIGLIFGCVSMAYAQESLKQPDYSKNKRLRKLKLTSITPQTGHIRKLSSLSFSPDGTLLASASGLDDGLVKVWNVVTGQVLHTLDGEDYVSFSADGKILASGNSGGPIVLWDMLTGKKVKTLKGSGPIAFTPDGKWLVGEGVDKDGANNKLTVWSTKDWSEVMSLEGHKASLTSISVSRDGRFVVTGSYDESVKIWDLQKKEILRTFKERTDVPAVVSLSPDAETLAIAFRDKVNGIELWDVSASKLTKTLKAHTKSITAMDWTPDGKTLVSASLDDTTNLWNVANSQVVKSVKGGGMVKVAPKGKLIAHGHQDIDLVDAASGKSTRILAKNATSMFGAFFSRDNKQLMTTDSLRTLDIWDIKTGKFVKRVSFENGTEAQAKGELIFSPHGKWAALRPFEGTKVVIFDAATGKSAKTINVEDIASVRDVTFSTNEEEIVIESIDSDNDDKTRLLWWSLKDGKAINQTGIEGFVRIHGFADGGQNVAMVSHGTSRSRSRLSVKVWVRQTGLLKPVKVKDIAPYAGDVRFAHKGQWIALGDEDNTVKLFDRKTNAMSGVFKGHSELINLIQFSENDKLVATGSWDESVKVWDVTKKTSILNINDINYKAQSLKFSPNHKFLAVSHKGWVRLVDVASGKWRNLYKSGAEGWMVHDSQGKFDCGASGCKMVAFRNSKGDFVPMENKTIQKALKGVDEF